MTGAVLRVLSPLDENAFSWPDALRSSLRPEFQTDVYFPKPGEPVLYGPTCAVQGCPGRGVNRSLGLKAKGKNHSIGTRFRGYVCLAHVAMWRRDGQPPIDAWVRHAARMRRGQVPKPCRAGGCPRSACRAGFCSAHESRYVRAGRPGDIAAFARDIPAVAVGEQECHLNGCAFPAVGAEGLCDAHIQRLRNL